MSLTYIMEGVYETCWIAQIIAMSKSFFTKYCGLTKAPFDPSPDPKFLYLSVGHQEALASILFGVKRRLGFMLLTGEAGTGKTILIRALIERLESKICSTILFPTSQESKRLLKYLCQVLNLRIITDSTTELLVSLNEYLLNTYQNNKSVIVIFDDAHCLKSAVLEEIKFLSKMEFNKRKLIQIIMVGRSNPGASLDELQFRQLKQQSVLKFELECFDLQETTAYIQHRLRIAGYRRKGALFTKKAIREIFIQSCGNPRLINTICNDALMVGAEIQTSQIDAEIIRNVQVHNFKKNRKNSGEESEYELLSQRTGRQRLLSNSNIQTANKMNAKNLRYDIPYNSLREPNKFNTPHQGALAAAKVNYTIKRTRRRWRVAKQPKERCFINPKSKKILKKNTPLSIAKIVMIVIIYLAILYFVFIILRENGII